MRSNVQQYPKLLSRRECILAVALTPCLRGAQTYRSAEEALSHRQEATTLILNRTPVGDEIGELPKLTNLILNRNDLSTVPAAIAKLKTLKAIFVGGNSRLDFEHVIEVLATLPRLEGVGLDDNQMRVVPANIGKLKTCKRLGLSSNELVSLPATIADLQALESLDLYNNRLSKIPGRIRELRNLKRIYIRDSGLSKDSLSKALPGVEVNTDLPPEVYLQLK